MSKILDVARKFIPKWTKKKTSTSFVNQKQWVDSGSLTDDVFDELYTRMGLAHKLVERLANDRFDKWYEIESDNESLVLQLALLNSDKEGGMKIRNTFKKARKFALRHGYSLVFIEYEDQAETLADPVINPRRIVRLENIKKTEIQNIIFDKDENSPTFGDIKGYKLNSKIFGDSLTEEIIVDASRVIHVPNGDDKDPEGMSMYKPMYNWLNMFDDIAWSIGQSYFRYGSGFPVLTVKGWSTLSETEQDVYQAQWKNVNSMTAYIAGDGDTVEFAGAQGRALDPKEFFEAGLMLVAASGDLPYALVVGVNAGAVSGSETNLKDYYSDVGSRQTLEEQPLLEKIYNKLIETGQLVSDQFIINWNSLFVHTDKERAEIDKMAAEAREVQFRTGFVTKEVADDIETGLLIEVEKTPQENQFPFDESKKFICSCIKCNYKISSDNHCNTLTCPKCGSSMRRAERPGPGQDQLNKKDRKVIRRKSKDKIVSKFSEPQYVRMQDKYFNELDKIFKIIETSVIQVAKGYDADQEDVIKEQDFKKMQKSIDKVFTANSPSFNPIVKTNIRKGLDEGVISSEGELGIDIPVSRSALAAKQNVIEPEHLKVVQGLADDINKDISTKLGIISLNPVGGFAEIEAQIKDSFSKRKGQLKMGVGNEINSALNQGNLLGYEDSGIVVGKEWVSFIDGNTTNTCVSLNGEVVPIGEAFSSGDFAPPAMDPPHPCRSSMRAVTIQEGRTLGFGDSKQDINITLNTANKVDTEHIQGPDLVKQYSQNLDQEAQDLLKKKELQVLEDKKELIKELRAKVGK